MRIIVFVLTHFGLDVIDRFLVFLVPVRALGVSWIVRSGLENLRGGFQLCLTLGTWICIWRLIPTSQTMVGRYTSTDISPYICCKGERDVIA